MTPEEYKRILLTIENPPRYLRSGQAAMNLLYRISIRVYASVCEKDLDCFYLDSKVPDFLKFLQTKIDS